MKGCKRMNIGVVGWYGTETIGDRAILFGICKVINNLNEEFKIHLGSLYPIFTDRTVKEDEVAYGQLSNLKEIYIYDVYNKADRNCLIDKSDIVLIGGGPLMDLRTIDLLLSIEKETQRKKKKFLVFGCGVGPLISGYFRNKTYKLCKNADLVIVRDKSSYQSLINEGLSQDKIKVYPDPAVYAAIHFKKKNKSLASMPEDYYAFNFRDYQNHFARKSLYDADDFANAIDSFIECEEEKGKKPQIYLVPMHNFAVGGDDRIYLNNLNQIMKNRINVINDPLSMLETFSVYENALGCFGMRYHSVVLQTVLNGNNAILDYTNGKKGKIRGFIDDLEGGEFYDKRICSLQDGDQKKENVLHKVLTELTSGEKYLFDSGKVSKVFEDLTEDVRHLILL